VRRFWQSPRLPDGVCRTEEEPNPFKHGE
jgi:hypothetical protein